MNDILRTDEIRKRTWGSDEEPAYEIDYSKAIPHETGGDYEGATEPALPRLPVKAQISMLEAYLYLSRVDIRGI